MCLLVFILILLFFSTVGLFYELIYLTLDNVICDLQQIKFSTPNLKANQLPLSPQYTLYNLQCV